jgi:hypothetical protein
VPRIQNVVALPPRQVELVEISRTPRTLTTLTNVTRQVDRAETGIVFLLSEGKVTVIRRTDAENQYEIDQMLKRNSN